MTVLSESSPAASPAPRGKAARVLVVSQTFVPDPASVGQHMADVAFDLARRGHAVRVYASGRGYENPAAVYPRREMLRGVDVRRFPLASFGKKSLLLRVLGTAIFHLQAFCAVLVTPRLAGIFFSTSPPLIGLPMCIVAAIRRVPAAYWAMDLNPDQLIALGKLKPDSLVARMLEMANRFIIRRSVLVIALDRFMAQRLRARGAADEKILILPPWPHEEHIQADSLRSPTAPPAANPFRLRHNLGSDFVIMYSGNHSPSNPLTTLLEAAVRLREQGGIRFLFVGGGSGKAEVNRVIAEHRLTNVLSLPYQPLVELKHSLSAADVHVVSLGEPMVGIIHPCKIYGAMSAARPVLFLGPGESHIGDLLARHDIGVHLRHGDVDAAVAAIHQLRLASPRRLAEMGQTARAAVEQSFTQALLCGRFCDALERALGLQTAGAAADPVPSPSGSGLG